MFSFQLYISASQCHNVQPSPINKFYLATEGWWRGFYNCMKHTNGSWSIHLLSNSHQHTRLTTGVMETTLFKKRAWSAPHPSNTDTLYTSRVSNLREQLLHNKNGSKLLMPLKNMCRYSNSPNIATMLMFQHIVFCTCLEFPLYFLLH